jgi:hypothetical protein
MRPEASRASSPNPTANLVGSRKAGLKRREAIRGVCILAAQKTWAPNRLLFVDRLVLVLRYRPLIRLDEFNLRYGAQRRFEFVSSEAGVFSRLTYSRINSLQDLWPSAGDLQ